MQTHTEQLALFDDIEFRPTIAMQKGQSFLAQCGWCGVLVCVPSQISGRRKWIHDLGDCPSCDSKHTKGPRWHGVDLGTGPFQRPS